MGWQPIETVKRDRWIIGLVGGYSMPVIWNRDTGRWYTAIMVQPEDDCARLCTTLIDGDITEWQPLPEPPTA